MPVGKKDMTMFHVNKERAPGCTANTFEGSSLFISVVERPLGYLLSLSCLSNHLQMRWQVTPAATVTKKDMTISICSPPPVAGYRLDNTVSITYLLSFWKYKQFLKVYQKTSKLLFWLLLSYWSSRNPLFLSNKKSWWRELNPYSLPLECRKIKAFQTFSLSNFE